MILLHGFGDRGQDHIETEHRGFAMDPRCARHWPPHACENEELTAGQAGNSPHCNVAAHLRRAGTGRP
jgi:hypothetical protein